MFLLRCVDKHRTHFASTLKTHSNFFFRNYILSPFGYNEFDGAGSGYAIKFASLSNIDENVVVGSTPATGKNTTYGDLYFFMEFII